MPESGVKRARRRAGLPWLFDSEECSSHFYDIKRGQLVRLGKQLVVNARAVAASEVFDPPNSVVPEDTSVRGRGIAVVRQDDLIVISASHFDRWVI